MPEATMALDKLSNAKKTEWLQKLYRFKENHRSQIQHQTEAAVDTLVAVGAGAGFAVADKVVAMVRPGKTNILGNVSNPLLLGGAAKAAAFLGLGGTKLEEQLHTVGNVGLGIGTYEAVKGLDILKPKGAMASGATEDADAIRRGIK